VADIDIPGTNGRSAPGGVRSDLDDDPEVVTEQEVVAGEEGVDSELRNEPSSGPAEAAGAGAAAVETDPAPAVDPAAGPGVRPEDPAAAGTTSDTDGSEEPFGKGEAPAEAAVAQESLGPEAPGTPLVCDPPTGDAGGSGAGRGGGDAGTDPLAVAMAWIHNYYSGERLAEIRAQHRAVMGHLADEERDE
jgi:hypothetical protein